MMPLPNSPFFAAPAPRFLASVRDLAEAQAAHALGAEVIDLKEPAAGALGAVPDAERARIVAALGHDYPPISATVGDLPFAADALLPPIARASAAGVDLVKFGVFGAPDAALAEYAKLDSALRAAPPRARLVVLLLADELPDLDAALALARGAMQVHGVVGVMLDTARKGPQARRLAQVYTTAELTQFVAAVHDAGGFAGLAGSLQLEDIEALVTTGADVLGFRGALCAGPREAVLDAAACSRVRDQLVAARTARKACGSASNTTRVDASGQAAALAG